AGAAGATSVTTTNVIAEEVAIELLLQAWEGGATDAARPSAHQLQPAVQEVHVQPWRADQEQDLDISTRNVTDRMVSATLVVGIEDLLTHEIYMVHERPLTLLPGADWTFPLEFGVLELHGPHRFIAALPELPKARIAPSAPVYFYQG
ncbi:MAG: hypothetical protein K0U93_21305, partial [Gammaproteobacteria bacterium]|nr:hypothetical protein [Gammaproteobacteria bacterium]